jgi:hypothetical protein
VPKMLVPTVLLTMLALPTLITAVNDVIRGVPSPDAINTTAVKTLKEAAAISGASTPTPGKLRVVENSGICGTCICLDPPAALTSFAETTPGVYQASGYGDLSANESMWFVSGLGDPICHTLLTSR